MPKPAFHDALKFWLKLGFISFGGPAGQISIMHEYLVEKKKWISESKFMHALNYCMLLPGPEAQQLAIYTGWLLHGIRGGLAAGILFILPSMVIILGLSFAYVTFGNISWVYAIFTFLKPAVIAIVILALLKIGKKSLLTSFHFFIAFAAFICIFFFNISFPLIILGSILLAVLVRRFLPPGFGTKHISLSAQDPDESPYYINKDTVQAGAGFKLFRLLKQIIITTILWTIPLVAFYSLTNDFDFWKKLSLFFTQAVFVTFGGAYAVLPYVAQVSVEKFNWLSHLQMLDGLALGETTPGPLIMVLVFVGFMAGYNHFGGSLAMGTLGLLATTFYTFLPCFLFIFAGAPIIERTQQNKNVKEILSLVTAAVVGVILNLTIYLGKIIIFPKGVSILEPDYLSLAWIVVSFFALYRLKLNIIAWIGISALMGLVFHLLTH